MTKKPSILIHYTHLETLGHTIRVLALTRELIRQGARVTVLQGGLPQPFIRFPRAARVIPVPHPFSDRDTFKGVRKNRATAQRARFVLRTAETLRPDIFITEFFPFGQQEYLPELLPAIRFLKKNKTRIYASIGYPLLSCFARPGQELIPALLRQVIALYNKILIHTPPGLEEPYHLDALPDKKKQRQYKAFLSGIKNKLEYTGYIVPDPEAKSGTRPPSRRFAKYTALVSRGGGAVYPKIIASAIGAKHLLGSDYQIIIACGPSTTTREKNLFRQLIRKAGHAGIHMYLYIPQLESLIKTCSVSVNLCGYNTSVQLLQDGTPCIAIPYQNQVFQEPSNDQVARAQLLKDHLPCTVLAYKDLCPKTLAHAIRQTCEARPERTPAPDEWFNGAAMAAKTILK